MEIKPKTVDNIVANAKAAKEVYDELLHNNSLDVDFSKCFHLRPTSSGITIVSTLPYAPMRGKTKVHKRELKNVLKDLDEKICGKDTNKAANVLHDVFEFKKRKTKKNISDKNAKSEEEVQSDFIKGLLSRQSGFEGFEFVASELMLNKEKRFDVVAIQGKVLYIFELKKNEDPDVISQVLGYVAQVEGKENESAFRRVLRDYPNRSVDSFDEVKGVVVAKRADNEANEKLIEATKENDVELWLWYYESVLHIDKVKKGEKVS